MPKAAFGRRANKVIFGEEAFLGTGEIQQVGCQELRNSSSPKSRLNSLCLDVPDDNTGVLGTGHQMIGVFGHHHARYRSAMSCERNETKLVELTCKHGL